MQPPHRQRGQAAVCGEVRNKPSLPQLSLFLSSLSLSLPWLRYVSKLAAEQLPSTAAVAAFQTAFAAYQRACLRAGLPDPATLRISLDLAGQSHDRAHRRSASLDLHGGGKALNGGQNSVNGAANPSANGTVRQRTGKTAVSTSTTNGGPKPVPLSTQPNTKAAATAAIASAGPKPVPLSAANGGASRSVIEPAGPRAVPQAGQSQSAVTSAAAASRPLGLASVIADSRAPQSVYTNARAARSVSLTANSANHDVDDVARPLPSASGTTSRAFFHPRPAAAPAAGQPRLPATPFRGRVMVRWGDKTGLHFISPHRLSLAPHSAIFGSRVHGVELVQALEAMQRDLAALRVRMEDAETALLLQRRNAAPTPRPLDLSQTPLRKWIGRLGLNRWQTWFWLFWPIFLHWAAKAWRRRQRSQR